MCSLIGIALGVLLFTCREIRTTPDETIPSAIVIRTITPR
jgi:hypothetical protein